MPRAILNRVVTLALASAFALSAADNVVGTWVLDLKKSVYRPGPPPRSQTRVYRESAAGITATVVTVGADGKANTVEYPVNYDGQAHEVLGSPDIDGIQMKRINNLRSESALLHGGKVFAKAVREVAADGNTLTITYEATTGTGDSIRNISHYDRR